MAEASGIRARNRAAIEAELTATAGRHLAEYGAAGLSLRAIARDMGMVSSGIYRYVASRDELLTQLIVAAYNDLADAVEATLAGRGDDVTGIDRFRTISIATRQWALRRPHEFALIYGSPVPGYHAPPERTMEAGTRVPQLLFVALAGLDHPQATPAEEQVLGRFLQDPSLAPHQPSASTLRRGLAAWTLVLGTITAELFEQFGADTITDPDAFFELMLDDAAGLLAGGPIAEGAGSRDRT